MDIKAQIEKVVETVKKDQNLLSQFQKEPVKAVEKVIGIDLPDDVINKVVAGVKTKITADMRRWYLRWLRRCRGGSQG